MAKLSFIISLVVVVAVATYEKGAAGAGDGGFEAVGLGDDKVRGDAAVGPASHAELARVGNALLDGVIHHGHVVLKVLVAPIGIDGFGVFFAVARGSARIGKEDGVAVGGVELGEMSKFGVVSPYGTTVRAENGGVFLAGNVIEGFVEVAGDGDAVLTFEMDVLAVTELELAHERVVGVGNLRKFSLGGGRRDCEKFVGTVDGGDLGDEVAIGGERVVVDHETTGDGAGDFAAGYGDATDVLGAVVVGNEINGFAVGREARCDADAIKGERKDFGLAARGGGDGDVLGGVIEELGIELGDISEPLTVRRPGGCGVGAGVGGDLRGIRSLIIWRRARRAGDIVRGDDPDV